MTKTTVVAFIIICLSSNVMHLMHVELVNETPNASAVGFA